MLLEASITYVCKCLILLQYGLAVIWNSLIGGPSRVISVCSSVLPSVTNSKSESCNKLKCDGLERLPVAYVTYVSILRPKVEAQGLRPQDNEPQNVP